MYFCLFILYKSKYLFDGSFFLSRSLVSLFDVQFHFHSNLFMLSFLHLFISMLLFSSTLFCPYLWCTCGCNLDLVIGLLKALPKLTHRSTPNRTNWSCSRPAAPRLVPPTVTTSFVQFTFHLFKYLIYAYSLTRKFRAT